VKKSTQFVLIISCGTIAFGQLRGTFSATGNMTVSRYVHTATPLPNGKVLIAGGQNPPDQSSMRSAELYNPATRAFTPTGDMIFPRSFHSATLLPDGKVLIAGGTGDHYTGSPLTSAELYDPDTEKFSATGDMNNPGPNTAILLASGKVLIAHDRTTSQLATAELYDPVTGTFSRISNQLVIHSGHQQTVLLPDGRVLLAICCTFEQIYDPAKGAFNYTGKTKSIYQDAFAAVSLGNGMVLVQGGYLEEANIATAGADLYDPSQGTFMPTGKMTMPRYWHTATLLGDGTVLIAGGFGLGNPVGDPTAATAEIYDSASGTFSRTGDLTTARAAHTTTLLLDGTVLIGSGDHAGTAEIYRPALPVPTQRLFTVDTQGQGAIWHADTGEIASAFHPAAQGQILSMYTTNLITDGVVPPQVALGGRLAKILYFGPTSEYLGYFQVNFAVPSGITADVSVPVRLTYAGRSRNEVRVAIQ
jgi:hypothetical protein